MPPAVQSNRIDADQPFPAKPMRFGLDWITLGRLEKLARARFFVGELSEAMLDRWVKTPTSEEVLVQSVYASSEIEGEGVGLDELPIDLAAVTEAVATTAVDRELSRRLTAVRDITEAAMFALQSDRRTYLDTEFVVDLHRRMFHNSNPSVAGRIKDRANVIRGTQYDIEMLPPEKAPEFLDALCLRTDAQLRRAVHDGEASTVLTIAEFVCDFLAIHPFLDGNGRTSRLLSTYLLDRCGYRFTRFYPLDTIILETRNEFYQALYRSQLNWYGSSEDTSPWIRYYVSCVYQQWQRANARVQASH
jgi:Fic family protein